MVSAQLAAFELFIDGHPLTDLTQFMEDFNRNLPPDIRAINIKEVDAKFNIIKHPKQKEYLYLFAHGTKSHPFAAPLLATFIEPLDIAQMTQAAEIFVGKHSFHNYCTKPTAKTILEREIEVCEIVANEEITASFFPDETYALRVKGAGFLRNQIRLMMGSLVLVGKGEMNLEDIEQSLKPQVQRPLNFVAPGSGLILNKIDFS